MRRRGLTLIELMVTLGITVILITSVAFAYAEGVKFQSRVPEQDAQLRSVTRFENRLRRIFEGSFLTSDETDQASYFMTLSSTGDLANPDTVVFTTLGMPVSGAYLMSTDEFETLNERFGPQGGAAEVALSMVPIGEPPTESTTTLYVRVQRPPDGDPTQGGLERSLVENIESFAFEFFDGIEWLPDWDTQTRQRRLPAAVRITYRIAGDETDRILTVRVPLSDVTPDNPIVQEIGG
jgi:prepilin-type N-terminal cleavage/methylation domain-containing protein